MQQFKTTSGASVVINPAPWKDANAFKQVIQREFAGMGIKMDLIADTSALLAAVMQIDSSPFVYAALFECLSRCTYNEEKITEKTFESTEARKDYYEIVAACIKENILPLFVGLYSQLVILGLVPEIQAQKPPK